jgi:hypothetical protein
VLPVIITPGITLGNIANDAGTLIKDNWRMLRMTALLLNTPECYKYFLRAVQQSRSINSDVAVSNSEARDQVHHKEIVGTRVQKVND